MENTFNKFLKKKGKKSFRHGGKNSKKFVIKKPSFGKLANNSKLYRTQKIFRFYVDANPKSGIRFVHPSDTAEKIKKCLNKKPSSGKLAKNSEIYRRHKENCPILCRHPVIDLLDIQ